MGERRFMEKRRRQQALHGVRNDSLWSPVANVAVSSDVVTWTSIGPAIDSKNRWVDCKRRRYR
jgi:hypothetical protein